MTHHELPREIEPGTEPDLNTPGIVFTGVVGGLIVIVTVALLQALYYAAANDEIDRKNAQATTSSVTMVSSQQLEQLNTMRWVDTANGIVSVPIDRAKDLVLAESAGEYESAAPQVTEVSVGAPAVIEEQAEQDAAAGAPSGGSAQHVEEEREH
jgi:hypothetical protein